MVLLNFGHPLTNEHIQRVQEITGSPVDRVVDVPTHFDHKRPFTAQVVELVDNLGFSPRQWQTEVFLISPPTLHIIAVTLLAELHGRMGYFPAVLRLRPNDQPPPPFRVAEVISLQAVRDQARERRCASITPATQ